MNLVTFLQLCSACLGILGSLFFAIGVVRQNTEVMAKLSGTYWNANPHMVASLASQRADYIFGGGIIVGAFALQFVSFLVPSDVALFSQQSAQLATWGFVPAGALAFFALHALSGRLAKHFEHEIMARVKAEAGNA